MASRVLRRIAFFTALGVAQLTGCLGDSPDRQSEQTSDTGSLRLALQATAPSGNVYRLHALFEIRSMRTGEIVAFLSSEQEEFSNVIRLVLDAGDYTVTLMPGWLLERVRTVTPDPVAGRGGADGSGGKGFGGSFVAGSSNDGGKGGAISPPRPDLPVPPIERPLPGDIDVGVGGGFVVGGEGGAGGAEIDPFPTAGFGVGGAPIAGGGSIPKGGAPVAGTGGFGGDFVEAQLLSNAVQPFSLFGGDDAFINYHFRVGNDIIDFSQGRVHIGFSVDDSGLCTPPQTGLDPDRVLLEHSELALSVFSLREMLQAIATNEGHGTDPVRLYHQIIDSYATAAEGRLPDAVHCGDEATDGQPTLNGYPITCNRRERFQFDNLDRWRATAVVNRLDLAAANGAHCGQQRVIFANNEQGRMFLILEAQIPNPRPDLGVLGCVPLADFWIAQNSFEDPGVRGKRLREAFIEGSPELVDAGFGPFASPSNFTVGTGQIRSNNFDQDPWTLREFKIALDGADLTILPFPVAEAPNGGLWNDELELPQGDFCRENFIIAAFEGLLTNNPAEMTFIVDQVCKDAESRNDFSQAYAFQLSNGFRAQLDQIFAPFGLTGEDIANRAHFAGSCIGCHIENNGVSLGNGVVSPISNGFVHVSEFPFPCADGLCFPISPALQNVFLPDRLRAMADLVGFELPPDPCQGGGGGMGGFAGFGGAAGFPIGGTTMGGFAGLPEGGVGEGGNAGSGPIPGGPAPQIDIAIPQASTSVEALQARDAEIRAEYGEKTLSGRDARSTH